MRILHVIPTLDHASGGPSVALTGLATALRAAGADVTVAVDAPRADDPVLRERVAATGVEVLAGGLDGAALDRAVAACDVCHIHAVWEGVLHRTAVVARRHRKPHLFRPCGMLDPWCLAQGRLKKKIYIALRLRRDLDACSAIHFTTPIERDLVAPLGFRAPAIVEPNGVDLAEFDALPAPGTFRRAHPPVGDRRIVLFLSRVHPKKGLDVLIPAFAAAADRDACLVIAGPDEAGYGATVRSMIESHGLVDRVVMTGLLPGAERLAAYVDAELFVLPSYQENFGVVVVEALAAGTPVIISDQVNLHPEITEASVGAVTTTTPASVTEALDRWLADDDARAAMAARCRPFVQERFDWNRIAARWLQRYRDFAGHADSGSGNG